MNIARARGLAEALREHPERRVREVGMEIEKALRWEEGDEYAATQRTLGAMVAKYGANLSEESEEQAKILAFVALAGIGK
jgi:hypothetical protein